MNEAAPLTQTGDAGREIAFNVNGQRVTVDVPPVKRLSDVLRDDLGLTGTKIGCNAGDCGACSVLVGGKLVCGCLTPVSQAEDTLVVTVEGLKAHGTLSRVQQAFQKHGAAQCGICTPGMLMASVALLGGKEKPSEEDIRDALGGVLCRCTGYGKIVDAVKDAVNHTFDPALEPETGAAVGARLEKVDGLPRVTGETLFGADGIPAGALWLRAVRSPHASARVTLGDFAPLLAAHPGLERVLTHADVPFNGFGIYPDIKDQPVLARDVVRHRGEAVVALVGDKDTVEAIDLDTLPITYEPLPAVDGLEAALAAGAHAVQADKPDNILIRGRVVSGDADGALDSAAHVATGSFNTRFVEHAYIEPEAGYAERVGDRLELHVSTQAPYMDRDEVANVMGIAQEDVRIIPTACGGGFGGKLDLGLQPLIAVAAWLTGKPVACVYTRPESMASSTKRHPSNIDVRMGCDADGTLTGFDFSGDFDTGAYASWGPTVAGRVPVHASGPYKVPHVRALSAGVFTNNPPSGAFRGFGVPQAAIAQETMLDDLAGQCGLDRLEIRHKNAIRAGDTTPCGQTLQASAGLAACLEALQPHWSAMLDDAKRFNGSGNGAVRRGAGIGCMWYGIGNTGMSNPSTMRVVLGREGAVTLYNGAVDIGQGSNTIFAQICADALGVPVGLIRQVNGDTDLTADAGKTSASRQTYVSGKAVELAAADLRAQILRQVNAGPDSRIAIADGAVTVSDGETSHRIDLAGLPVMDGEDGGVLAGHGTFDPPTQPLDEDGQGVPYACYGFAAQIISVDVDVELGTVKVNRIVAAHDVGKAVNPIQVEGQIQGGIAQGLGLALMEEYHSGVTDNLHDYLIPTIGDVPDIDVIIVEDGEPTGPSGAKGVGEPGLVPTPPAILSAIKDATGVRITEVPATPHRVRAALRDAGIARRENGQ